MSGKKEEVKLRTMTVKTVRKGFYCRIRQPGQTFSFTGTKCPSWCVELNVARKVDTKSGDLRAADAAAYLKTLSTQESVFDFVTDGEDRKGVLDAQEEALARIAAELD